MRDKLTPADIEAIVTIADDVLKEIPKKELIAMGKDWYYKMVLDRYKESKRKANKG